MKRLLLLLLITFWSITLFAELRSVAITCHAVIETDTVGSKIITGFKYNLYTRIKSEETENADLKDLITTIEEVAWYGSSIEVFIFSDHGLSFKKLKSLINAIESNPQMRIAYIENGVQDKMTEKIKKQYKL